MKSVFLKVMDLAWNIDSTVLAVWAEELPPEESTQEFVPKSYGKYPRMLIPTIFSLVLFILLNAT